MFSGRPRSACASSAACQTLMRFSVAKSRSCVGERAQADVQRIRRVGGVARGLQRAQRLDARAGGFPAPRGDQHPTALALEFEVDRGVAAGPHGVAVAPEALLEQRRERLPRRCRQGLVDFGDARRARQVPLAPRREGGDDDEGQRRKHADRPDLIGKQRPAQQAERERDPHTDPPGRAQQDREQRVLCHLQFQTGLLGVGTRRTTSDRCRPTVASAAPQIVGAESVRRPARAGIRSRRQCVPWA